MSRGIYICLWTKSMTFNLTSGDPDAMFQVWFGFGGSSQMRGLVFGLWTIQPICIEFTIGAAILAKHNAS